MLQAAGVQLGYLLELIINKFMEIRYQAKERGTILNKNKERFVGKCLRFAL